MNKIYFFCLALFCFCSATAQDISATSVKWNVVSTFYAEEGNTVDEATSLLTLAGNKIEWQKINGALKRSFKIVKTIGTWTNINNSGAVRYQVTEGEKDGTILIQRDGKEIKAHILIVGENPESFELTITNAESL